jgi:predicted transcriptional regulator
MSELQEAVKKYASDLAAKLNSFMEDISMLEVRTYTTPADQVPVDLSGDKIKTEGKAVLRAYTTIGLDGDTTALAPTDAAGEVNAAVWELHQTMVKQALENRTAMIKTMGEAAASALKALGQAGG